MKILILLGVFLFVCATAVFAQNEELNLVPQPKSVNRLKGEFTLNFKTKIIAMDETGRKSAGILNDLLMKNYGFKLEYASVNKIRDKNIIFFYPEEFLSSKKSQNEALPPEGYGLNVEPEYIKIVGSETGQFYALQTLMQILPAEFKGEAKISAVYIIDEPRFGYRGMHLDVGRHFMPVEFVKKYIDLMSQYKFNEFHWHLTEDQGWRIEIKKYPRLTEVGSKRSETVVGRNINPYVGDGVPVEGFYTQAQIKDLVAYAKARHINVIPEIELPGHSSAALTAYPNLGCRQNYTYKVQTTWGIFKEVYCPKEETFQFLEDVIGEVIDLFPDSPYIHIGGDEVLKDFWKDSPEVKALEAKENLKDEHEVQSYFIRRIEKYINSKGKKIIGWDEILEGGVAPNATIMSWRGEKGGIDAAKAKHDVIMTPNTFLYFDYGQGDPQYEPVNIGNYVPLEKVYSYNPESAELTADEKKHVLGAQANVWTEYLKTPDKVEYMVFPRMLALAEVNWSPQETRNYADFTRRMNRQYQSLDKQNVNYRIPPPRGLQNILLENADKTKIELSSPLADSKIYYTTDGSEPNLQSKLYDQPFELTLKQGEKVDVKTIVVNEKGRKSVTYAAIVLHRNLSRAADLKDKTAGVGIKFYKNGFSSVKELEAAAPTETIAGKSSMLPQFGSKTNALKDPFGASFEGYLDVPADAIYEFELESVGGSALAVDGESLIDLDGKHTKMKQTGLIPLAKGLHKIRLNYFQAAGDAPVLNLRWGVKGTGLQRIYGSELFVPVISANL